MQSYIPLLTSLIGNAACLPLPCCVASTDVKFHTACRPGYSQDGICCNIVHDITSEVVDMDRVVCEGRRVSRRREEPGQLEMGGVQLQHCHIVWRVWKRTCRQQDHMR